MMELRHIAMINWHLFDVEDIEIEGHTGVFGENRSGKSTILDMAQVVLTGGNSQHSAVERRSERQREEPKRLEAKRCGLLSGRFRRRSAKA